MGNSVSLEIETDNGVIDLVGKDKDGGWLDSRELHAR